MPDWSAVNGPAGEYGMDDPDMDTHDPAGHCGGSVSNGYIEPIKSRTFAPTKQRNQKTIVCRNCGTRNLEWRQLPTGKFWLHNGSDWHMCFDRSEKNLETSNISDNASTNIKQLPVKRHDLGRLADQIHDLIMKTDENTQLSLAEALGVLEIVKIQLYDDHS